MGAPAIHEVLEKRSIGAEIVHHAPFTLAGAISGAVIALVFAATHAPNSLSHTLFWTFHPLHVLLSAMTTAAMFRRNSKRPSILSVFIVGYVGSIGVATLSDSIIPYIGETLLNLPNRGVHLGFIEKWWLVNPLAIGGIGLAYVWETTKIPHAGHVLLSTWASLFHIMMAMGASPSFGTILAIVLFLFVAVLVPCCTSDIAFPLLLANGRWSQREE